MHFFILHVVFFIFHFILLLAKWQLKLIMNVGMYE